MRIRHLVPATGLALAASIAVPAIAQAATIDDYLAPELSVLVPAEIAEQVLPLLPPPPPEPISAGDLGSLAEFVPAAPEAAPPVYADCTEVWEAGAGPIEEGDPGFEEKFDADDDGVGCETDPR
ncbi:excalibur calcium-binding domain-containing protein [Lolliginicoccus levis]|uniref:excalibur calcium-binding domain-containing protein n=1 Tax=Lolliginicoccus levis TaxID=2919542 RepID=UPI00241EDF6F|nr:excalibur calcium-binding domain-containing protein [Lolliginicoccus levis]